MSFPSNETIKILEPKTRTGMLIIAHKTISVWENPKAYRGEAMIFLWRCELKLSRGRCRDVSLFRKNGDSKIK